MRLGESDSLQHHHAMGSLETWGRLSVSRMIRTCCTGKQGQAFSLQGHGSCPGSSLPAVALTTGVARGAHCREPCKSLLQTEKWSLCTQSVLQAYRDYVPPTPHPADRSNLYQNQSRPADGWACETRARQPGGQPPCCHTELCAPATSPGAAARFNLGQKVTWCLLSEDAYLSPQDEGQKCQQAGGVKRPR